MQIVEEPMEMGIGNGYVLYTEGAKGVGSLAEQQGVLHGMNVYIILSSIQERSRFITPLTCQQLKEPEPYVNKANYTLKRTIQGTVHRGYLQRNYWVIKDANYVFDFGEFECGFQKTTLKGDTGWSVQMALDHGNKMVYVFDKNSRQWYKPRWEKKRDKNRQWYMQHHFVQCSPPTIGMKSAILGTKKPSPEMEQAIKTLFESTMHEINQLSSCLQRFNFGH